MATRSESVGTANVPINPSAGEAYFKEWLKIASLVVLVVGGIFGVIFGATKLAIEPVQTNIESIQKQLDRLEDETKSAHSDITGVRQDMNDEFKAIRESISMITERLTRVETLLESRGQRTSIISLHP